MFSLKMMRYAGLQAVAAMLLMVGSLQAPEVSAQGFDLKSLCQAYPEGIKRAGCLQSMDVKQALIEAQEADWVIAPGQSVSIMATFSLLSGVGTGRDDPPLAIAG